MSGSPPLRFLAIVLGGWATVRALLIAPIWPTPPVGAAAAVQGAGPARALELRIAERAADGPGDAFFARPRPARPAPARISGPSRHAVEGRDPGETPRAFSPGSPGFLRDDGAAAAASAHPDLPPAADCAPSPRRWSLSAWSFVREGDRAPLAAAGLLGGSQAGARLTYRLSRNARRPLALSVRLSGPLRRPAAEAALGLDWRPARRLPLHLLAERRAALGDGGRSAFAVAVFGGIDGARLGRFRLDAFAQAGMVGARSRDGFADGSVRLSLPLGRHLSLGAGAWGAAQPDLSRLDLGPRAALRLPVAGRAVTLAADWRLRVAGNAAPGSGPSLTLGTDF